MMTFMDNLSDSLDTPRFHFKCKKSTQDISEQDSNTVQFLKLRRQLLLVFDHSQIARFMKALSQYAKSIRADSHITQQKNNRYYGTK